MKREKRKLKQRSEQRKIVTTQSNCQPVALTFLQRQQKWQQTQAQKNKKKQKKYKKKIQLMGNSWQPIGAAS